MFKKALEADLRKIFGVKKIVYNLSALSMEQDVLYVEISESKDCIKNGKASARVKGFISLMGTQQKNPFGFFSKKLQLAPIAIEKRFWFGRIETPDDMGALGWEVCTHKMPFMYNFEEDYNPAKSMLKAIIDVIFGR